MIEWIDDDSFVQIWKVIARQGENGELEFVENESKETNGLLHIRAIIKIFNKFYINNK